MLFKYRSPHLWQYSSCMKKTFVVELLILTLISNVAIRLGMCIIIEESTLKVVFLVVYIFVHIGVLLLEVCCPEWHTSASDTLFLCVCRFSKCIVRSDILLLATHFCQWHIYPSWFDVTYSSCPNSLICYLFTYILGTWSCLITYWMHTKILLFDIYSK